ncbi:hypothetical protein Q0590_02730 [Rhodocytophaga aerolata]|uniref:O-antigen ligase family protein n=1 Tax=Rhodocytophaga aerolata TaxID=455078 RepID=A0ABT8QZ72_9BACT|nr:hypothetical protein [Rhodocytophaga aerolata]MDO1445145.1 hypothetical protein [Rhodocytophaga aerolata]
MNKKKFLLFLWTFLLICFRPSIFGEKYNPLVFFCFLIVTGLIALSQNIFIKFKVKKKFLVTVTVILTTVLYFVLQGFILSDAKLTVLNSAIIILGTITCFLYVLNSANQFYILKFFIYIHFAFSISSICTFIIYVLTGFNPSNLPVLVDLYALVEYAVYDPSRLFSNHVILFPFTVVWSNAEFLGISVHRALGIYREPGMAQIFFLTAYFLTYFIPLAKPRLIRNTILAGSFLTFSTASFISFLFGIVIYKFANSLKFQNIIKSLLNPLRITIFASLFIIASAITYNLVKDKLNDISGQTRIISYLKGAKRLMASPMFGEGYYNSFAKNEEGIVISDSFIGLIGVSYQIGLIGIMLYLTSWYFGVSMLGNTASLCIYIPCFITLFTSQPSYNDVFTWFLLLIDTSHFKPISSL